jgi:hypothetical protein
MAYILAGEDGNGVSELEEDIARLAMGGLYGGTCAPSSLLTTD